MIRAAVLAAALTLAAPAALASAASTPEKAPPAAAPSASARPPAGSPAQGAATPAKPSPSAERVARALTTQENWNETIKEYASSLSSQISAAAKSQGGDVPKDAEQRIRSGLDKAVGYEEVVRLQAQALAGRFSEDELRQIGKFYESGPGKKLVAELPGVSRQVIETVQQRISAAIPHIVQDVAPSLARAHPSQAEGTAPESGAPKQSPPAQGRKPPAPAAPPRP